MTEHAQTRSGTETRQRRRVLQVRLTDEEHAVITAHAAQSGLTPASYARSQLLDAPPPRARRKPAVEAQAVAQVLAQLGKVGSNLNQLAHRANSGGVIEQRAAARALSDVTEMRDACMEALGRKP